MEDSELLYDYSTHKRPSNIWKFVGWSSAAIIVLFGIATAVMFAIIYTSSDDDDTSLSSRYLITNANIITMDPSNPTATTMLINNGRFVDVGDVDLLKRHPTSTLIDFQGKTIIPGLIDAHAHLVLLGATKMEVDLNNLNSISEVVETITEYIKQKDLAPGSWILGSGWDQTRWNPTNFPTRYDLDVSPLSEYYIWLRRVDFHAAWANSKVVNLSISENVFPANNSDPQGGKIVRDPITGEPTGIYVDNAMNNIDNLEPEKTDEQREEDIQAGIYECNKYGLTSIHDASVNAEEIELYKRLVDKNKYNLRNYIMVAGMASEEDSLEGYLNVAHEFCDKTKIHNYGNKLDVKSVKLMMDGALGSRGAAMIEPYSDDPDNVGLLFMSEDEFTQVATVWYECGYQVCTHAIGDLANRVVVETYADLLNKSGESNEDRRLRVEHAQIVHPDDFEIFHKNKIIASMQPTHATSDMRYAEDRVGKERIKGAYSWKKMLNLSVPLPLGSDFPVELVDPLLGIYAAVTRQDVTGWPAGGWYPEERLTRYEALYGFTQAAAYAAYQEYEIGSITPGKFADFVILSDNILDENVNILDIKVEQTFLGGKKVYQN
eukprot:TRINITY_DN11175_c0_g1_i1.p1 TRINITY_DN11175_c0_g1~~TRINITY_DN11175_c0_g1_i1.p1  ORF type:complete len:604 (+),score=136.19 TRINITY_DN11175_c0_g1_i1:23-1834(+)